MMANPTTWQAPTKIKGGEMGEEQNVFSFVNELVEPQFKMHQIWYEAGYKEGVNSVLEKIEKVIKEIRKERGS
jgi:hypothetical protein